MIALLQADAGKLPLADGSVDLVFGSPPYMDARTYGIGAQRGCQKWIDWMLDVTAEACRVSRGLVLWVCAGVTRKWCYWPGPEGLLYEWWKRGGQCWRPAYWRRKGIPGSGGRQWLRADVEYVLAFKKEHGPIPWADNTAMGHRPKWAPGGEKKRARRCTRGKSGGDTIQEDNYLPPVLANPGNLVTTKVGGGHMGHHIAHENEAPFPEALAEWFILPLCPPGGIVLDPFLGSGTTVAVAVKNGRNGIGSDLRMSECEKARRRLTDVQPVMF